MNAPPGNLRSAHFHPRFHGIEPCDRHWDEEIQRDAKGWLASELGDLATLLKRSDVAVDDADWLQRDAAALRDAAPAVVAAVQATWDTVRRSDA
jgi:hypothetical protein